MSYFILQIISLVLLWESPCEIAGRVELDEFQNVFVYDNNTISKFNKKGASHYTYSNLRKGDVFSLDVTNPMRTVVYYKDNNEVVFLDNTLSEQNEGLNFNDISFYDVSLVSSSFQNHLWIYRSAEQKLIRINRYGEIVNETSNLSLWLDDQTEDFIEMKESGNFLYLVSSSGLTLIFDQYGTFRKKINLSSTGPFSFLDSKVLYLVGSQLKLYDVLLHVEEVLLDDVNYDKLNEAVDFNLGYISVLKEGKVLLSRIEAGEIGE